MNALGVMIALEIALLGLVLALLNARDHRRDRAVATVLEACPRAWRGSITVHTRAPLLSRRVVVVLNMSDCDHGDVWIAVRPLADALPPDVALVIGTRFDVMTLACASSGSR